MQWIFVASAWACEQWSPPAELNAISHPDLTESSGLAASRRTPGAVWTHDDSGDAALYRFALDGTVTRHEAPDANNADWEDIAAAGCPGSGDCLYIGDIGLERNDPGNLVIYVVSEPKGDGPAAVKEVWQLTWPGTPRDAETLLVNPCTLDAWVVTRGDLAEVFKVPDDRGRKPSALISIATLQVEEPITAGDFSPDGTQIGLRSDETVWTWRVDADDPDGHWSDTPTVVATLDTPGEGMAWDLDGDLLFSNEGRPTPLSRMACQDAVEPVVCKPPGCGCTTPPGRTASLFWVLAAGVVLARRGSAAR